MAAVVRLSARPLDVGKQERYRPRWQISHEPESHETATYEGYNVVSITTL
jgi:hypothetical protein